MKERTNLSRVEVVQGTEIGGSAVSGSSRIQIFNRKGAIMAQFALPGGDISPWHHHGSRELLGLLIRGKLRLEYRSKKLGAVDLTPGDFFRIPRRLVHRDVNLSKSNPVVVVSLYLGNGPATVNVEGKEGGEEGAKKIQTAYES